MVVRGDRGTTAHVTARDAVTGKYQRTSQGSAVDRPSESKAGAEDPKLLKACQDFEAVFLTMIWKEMQKSANVDLGGWGAFAEQAMGENWAKSGGIGLAEGYVQKHVEDSPDCQVR